MSKAIVDPAELRRFAQSLKHFNTELGHELSMLQGQFAGLGDTWRDQEHDKFAQEFAETVQALTRFMKSLEASPFIQNVQLSRSDLVQSEGKEVTEFTLEAETQAPPTFAIKTVPLIVSAVR